MSVLKRDAATIVIEEDNSVRNSLQFTAHDDGTLYVEIDNPWAYGGYFTLKKGDASALAKFLAKWSKQ